MLVGTAKYKTCGKSEGFTAWPLPPTHKAGRVQNGLRLIENREEGREPRRGQEQRAAPPVQLPSPAAAAKLRKLLAAAVLLGGGRR